MVQGLPAVDWKKPENNAKLFAAVLALLPGTPDCKKIATAFGPNVPASAISYRLNFIRKEGVAAGFAPGSGSLSARVKSNGTITPAKRAAPTAKNVVKGKDGKGGKKDDTSDDADTAVDSEEEESAAETDDGKNPTTPPPSALKRQKLIGGRVTKRVSPRKSKETNYKKLDDPFVAMDSAKDENGNNVFGEPSGTESEDTYASNGSFKETGNDAVVKTEQEEEAV